MKVLVTVLTAEKMPYLKRIQACKETWIQYKPEWAKVWVLSGPKLGVPDSYDMMTFKIKALCRRALMDPSWQWLLRVDDDVCVDWRAVKVPETGDYIGPIVPRTDKATYTQGAVTWFSRRAIQTLYDRIFTEKGMVEDLEIGRIMNDTGLLPIQMDVHQIPRGTEINDWTKEQLMKLGFVLEVPTPEAMSQLHASLGLPPTQKKVKNMSGSKTLTPAVPLTAVYRDIQGRELVRNNVTFNGECGPVVPRGPAVSRPQEDPKWFVK